MAVSAFHQPTIAPPDRVRRYPVPAHLLDPAAPFGLPVLVQGMPVPAGWRAPFGRRLPLVPAVMLFTAPLLIALRFLVLAPLKGTAIASGMAPATAALVVAPRRAGGFGIAVWRAARRGSGPTHPG